MTNYERRVTSIWRVRDLSLKRGEKKPVDIVLCAEGRRLGGRVSPDRQEKPVKTSKKRIKEGGHSDERGWRAARTGGSAEKHVAATKEPNLTRGGGRKKAE